jgi:hypothetical protein
LYVFEENNYVISNEKGNSKAPAQKLNQQHPKKSLHKIIVYKTESKLNCDG